jgi:hypothetical protein
MNKIYRPLTSVEEWRLGLADSEKQWRMGYSARTLAHCWSNATGWPSEIAALWATSSQTDLQASQPLLMLPEHKVKVPGDGFPSQNDLFVLARTRHALSSVMIEGKVDETFGDTIARWRGGPEFTPNRKLRFDGLCALIGLTAVPDTIRYQLLHRTASAVIEAKNYTAPSAVMIVHSFSRKPIESDPNWNDFAAFVSLYEQTAVPDQLIELGLFEETRLFVAWVRGDLRYLEM